MTDGPGNALKRGWFRLLDEVIQSTSRLVAPDAAESDSPVQDVADFPNHEGSHPLRNPQYKEGWDLTLQTPGGWTMGAHVLLSYLPGRSFGWSADPATGAVRDEFEEEAGTTVRPWGSPGLLVRSAFQLLEGGCLEGYRWRFEGAAHRAEFELSDPVEVHPELHLGPGQTWYATHQIPRLRARGVVEDRETGARTDVEGLAWLEHTWGIPSRRQERSVLQAWFPNGWIVGILEGRHGQDGGHVHHRAWLYQPEVGYRGFDASSLAFGAASETDGWRVVVRGDVGVLDLVATRRAEHTFHRSVELGGIPMGNWTGATCPVAVEGTFTWGGGSVAPLTQGSGLVGWRWRVAW